MKKWIALVSLAAVIPLKGDDLDLMGVTLLRQVDPTLNGSGVKVAQVEAPLSGTPPLPFEVNPGVTGHLTNLFTYISSSGTATTFTNTVGAESWHANTVAGNFYGLAAGVATNGSHVDNYEAGDFFNQYIFLGLPLVSPARVVNQSFIFDPSSETVVNTHYDDYAAQNGTIFVSGVNGVNNAPPICAPGSCYNGIGVGAYYAFNLGGPTDDGRCKPDVVAPDLAQSPNGAVSYTTAYVSGGAAILVQAALRGDGGANTSIASDLRTIKALVLNGAVKPADWTNAASVPLDARYGAGLVNVFNSWKQLKGGQHAFIESTVTSGNAHPPGANTNNEPTLVGWDNNSISTSGNKDTINHYYFKVSGSAAVTLTATLAWNKASGATAINNLDLYLYNTSNTTLVTCSTSLVDNVEHLYLPALSPGRYDLQVWEKYVSLGSADTYALAYEMFSMPLSARRTNSSTMISWWISPTGFQLQSAPSLTTPVTWSSVTNPVSIVGTQNVVTVSNGAGNRFFRLKRPSF